MKNNIRIRTIPFQCDGAWYWTVNLNGHITYNISEYEDPTIGIHWIGTNPESLEQCFRKSIAEQHNKKFNIHAEQ